VTFWLRRFFVFRQQVSLTFINRHTPIRPGSRLLRNVNNVPLLLIAGKLVSHSLPWPGNEQDNQAIVACLAIVLFAAVVMFTCAVNLTSSPT
jgi:hypothetical protein